MTPVIIGFAVNGWNVYRALARHGVRPVVLDNEPDSIFWRAKGARLICEHTLAGAPLIAALNRVAADGREYVVLSATEEAVRTVSEMRGRLTPNVRLLFPEHETVAMLLDKKAFYQRARAGGFRISRMHFLETWEGLPAAKSIVFPCILKGRTKIYAPGLAKAYRIESYAELRDRVREIATIPGLSPSDFVIQEWVPGSDGDVTFCMQYYDGSSNPKLSFVGRKIRQWRPETGGTASAEAVEDEETLAETTRFFRGIRMHGICSMEFKRSRSDGKLYMIEPTACRADYQEGVAVANGCNIPYAAYCDAAGLAGQAAAPAGRRIKWLKLGDDYASAAHYVSRGELTWWEWARSLRGPKSYAVYAPEDRGPFVELIRRKMSNRLRRVWAWS